MRNLSSSYREVKDRDPEQEDLLSTFIFQFRNTKQLLRSSASYVLSSVVPVFESFPLNKHTGFLVCCQQKSKSQNVNNTDLHISKGLRENEDPSCKVLSKHVAST